MDRYTISLADHSPNQTTGPTITELGPIPAFGLTWGEELSREGEASASCKVSTLDSSITDVVADVLSNDDSVPHLELFVRRDATIVHRGSVVGLTVSDTGDDWTFRSVGPLYWLRYMYILARTVHNNVDDFTIAAGMIDQWQTQNFGDRGLDTSGVGLAGTTSDLTLEQGNNVFDRLTSFAEGFGGGFDVWVDLATLAVNFGTKGVDKTGTVVLDRRGITDAGLSISMAAGDIASQALALNTDDQKPLDSTATNLTLESTFGKTGVVGSFNGVTQQATLDDHATNLQAARDRPLVSPQPRLFPVAGVGVLDFETGDTVQFAPRIGVDLVLERRVLRKQVSVGDDGNEEISVALA